MKTKSIFSTLIILFAVTFGLLLSSCKNSVTDPVNADCGENHVNDYHFDPGQSDNRFLLGTKRVFVFDAIPTATIENICTHGKPLVEGKANWYQDTARPITIKLYVIHALNHEIVETGTITAPVPGSSEDRDQWYASINVGLEQLYGNGPGRIYDIRAEVTFETLGSEALDLAFLTNRTFTCKEAITYNDYITP